MRSKLISKVCDGYEVRAMCNFNVEVPTLGPDDVRFIVIVKAPVPESTATDPDPYEKLLPSEFLIV